MLEAGPKPLLYSCSGCSSAAQTTNWVALALDRAGEAEMSCIAGVGGKVGPLVRKARNASAIVALDGCSLACSQACLQGIGIVPDLHIDLSQLGIPKRLHQDFDPQQAQTALDHVRQRMEAL